MVTLKMFAPLAMLMGALMAGTANAADVKTIDVVLSKHTFTPNRIEVPVNTPFVLHVKNADATPAEFEAKTLKIEKVIAGGSTGKIRVGALQAGEHVFVDEYHEDVAKGLIVAQ